MCFSPFSFLFIFLGTFVPDIRQFLVYAMFLWLVLLSTEHFQPPSLSASLPALLILIQICQVVNNTNRVIIISPIIISRRSPIQPQCQRETTYISGYTFSSCYLRHGACSALSASTAWCIKCESICSGIL